MLNISLNAFNQSTATPPLTASTQDSSLPEPVITLLNDNTKLEAPYSLTTLQTQLQQQKAALNSTSSHQSSIDSNISDSLLGAINKSTEDVSILQGWTEGGAGMFNAANKVMFEALKQELKQALQSTDGIKKGFVLEDLFQLAVIDFMANSSSSTPENMKKKMAHYLESTGSGSHGVHENWNGQMFANKLQNVWDYIKNNSSEHSLSKSILNYLETNGGIEALKNQYNTQFNNQNGYAFRSNYDKQNYGLSPMLRLAVMSKFLSKKPDIVQADLELLISGKVNDIEGLLSKHLQTTTLEELLKDGNGNGWNIIDSKDSKNNGKIVDWTGVGLDLKYFQDLYTKFPSRVLGDEDIKEINRIGDNVKMIQQTLKYWYQIMRDERVAIARNI